MKKFTPHFSIRKIDWSQYVMQFKTCCQLQQFIQVPSKSNAALFSLSIYVYILKYFKKVNIALVKYSLILEGKYWTFQLYNWQSLCLISFLSDIKSSVLVDSASHSVCFVSKETPVYLYFVLWVYTGPPPSSSVVLFPDSMSHAYMKENAVWCKSSVHTVLCST